MKSAARTVVRELLQRVERAFLSVGVVLEEAPVSEETTLRKTLNKILLYSSRQGREGRGVRSG